MAANPLGLPAPTKAMTPNLAFSGGQYGGATPWAVGSQDFTANPAASQVSIDPNVLNSMKQYSDAAYASSQRTLDPQWQQKQAAFDQQMVGQGIQPGSQAYNNAYQNFSQSQNDAYSQARNQAMQQGLAAQGQAFGQGYENSQLANELAKQQMAGDASIQSALAGAGGQTASAMINANASMQNNALNNQTSQLLGLGNLGLGYGNLGLGYANMNNGVNQNNFNDMMSMMNFGNGQDIYNNSLPGQELNNMSPFMSQIPNGSPAPVDVTGAYGISQSGQNNAYNAQNNAYNGQNQMLGSLGSAAIMAMMMSSRALKVDEGPVDIYSTLEAVRSLPVHRWKYKGQDTSHVGTFAEDFNEALNLPASEGISIPSMFGALTGSIKALADKLDTALERIDRLEKVT